MVVSAVCITVSWSISNSLTYSKLFICKGKLYVKGQEVEFTGYVFECHFKRGKPVKVDANPNVLKIKPLHKERNYPVHCPSVIFQIFPDNGKAL